MKISGKKLLIILAIACAIAIGIAFARGIAQAEGQDVLRCLSDAFFVSGALILLSGGLVWCADNGVADGLTYGVSRLFRRRGHRSAGQALTSPTVPALLSGPSRLRSCRRQ